jgi:hypothetical protein
MLLSVLTICLKFDSRPSIPTLGSVHEGDEYKRSTFWSESKRPLGRPWPRIANRMPAAPWCPRKCFRVPARTFRQAAEREGVRQVPTACGFLYLTQEYAYVIYQWQMNSKKECLKRAKILFIFFFAKANVPLWNEISSLMSHPKKVGKPLPRRRWEDHIKQAFRK